MKYRLDIEGLRAIAVVAVVAVHIGLPGWQGGFVGVDVFFVISGFLISNLLLDEHARTGSISFIGFYARRMRRLLPALTVVLGATVLVAALFLNPVENQKAVMESAAASALFVANLFFWRNTGGYFDEKSDTMPLLHMWSLGVEEQWYLVFPALLVGLLALLSRFTKAQGLEKRLLWTMLLLAALGYALCIVGTEHRARAAFFILPTRAWEFLFGVCTALILRRHVAPGVRLAHSLSLLGLVGMVWSIVMLEAGQHFPGYIAAVPVASACFLIAAGKQPLSLAHRMLSFAPLRWVGLVSYSWYLWHWPLLVFVRILNDGEKYLPLDILFGGVLSLGLASLSYRFIEQPARHARGGHAQDGRSVVAGLALTLAMVVASAGGWVWSEHLEKQPRYRNLIETMLASQASSYRNCLDKFVNGIPESFPQAGCLYGDASAESTVMLWADSYGNHFASMMDPLAQDSEVALLLLAKGGCTPVNGIVQENKESICNDFNRAVTKEIEGLRGLRAVVLVARWWMVLGRDIDDPSDHVTMLHSNEGVPLERGAALRLVETQLGVLADQLESQNIRLLLVSPTPLLPSHVPRCLARMSGAECGISREGAERFSEDIRTVFVRLASQHSNVRNWDPLPYICDNEYCPAQKGTSVLYTDDNHLSFRGAQYMKEPFREEIWPWLLDAASASLETTSSASKGQGVIAHQE